MEGLSKGDILFVVNRHIGVKAGYLGDFSSHRQFEEFYAEYCDVEVDLSAVAGTMRQRFIDVLAHAEPRDQARILRGVLKRFPVGSSELRTAESAERIQELVTRLEAGAAVASLSPRLTSDVVSRAISDAETLLRENGATSGVDRMHTALHGYMRGLCEDAGIACAKDASMTEVYKLLRASHPGLTNLGTHSAEVDRILKSFAAAIDSLNTLRNRASVAHPNESLLPREEAMLCVNASRTLLAYLDAKASSPGSG